MNTNYYKNKSTCADASVGIASNINAGLYQHMHAFQVQQLQSLRPGTPQCKSLQLQASRVYNSNSNSAAKLCTPRLHQSTQCKHNTYVQLRGYRVRVPTQGRAFNCMLSGIVRVYRCMSYNELVRLCSFGSFVLWISLRLPSVFLYRSNCHVEK